MKTHEKPTWNHEKPCKAMKNQPGTMKNHEKPTWNHEKPNQKRYPRGVTTDLGGGRGRNNQKRYPRGVTTNLLNVLMMMRSVYCKAKACVLSALLIQQKRLSLWYTLRC